jgi:hypothetical protein
MPLAFFPRNSNTIELQSLTRKSTGAPITNATVTYEIRTEKYPAGTVIDSGTMPHSASGTYILDLDADIDLEAGDRYSLRVIAESTSGTYEAEDYFTAKARTGRTANT